MAYYQRSALERSMIFAGMNCDILPEDDLRYKGCRPEELPEPAVMFTKVRDGNDWWTWFDNTLLPNVRVQLWYNQAPPYRLRGYLDDRVNRLIGYAIVRQVREKDSHCPRPRVFRSTIVECTGAGGLKNEDDRDFCAGWHKWGSPNCTTMDEFKYTSAALLNSSTTTAKVSDYGGGGYVFQIRGYISDLEKKIQVHTVITQL